MGRLYKHSVIFRMWSEDYRHQNRWISEKLLGSGLNTVHFKVSSQVILTYTKVGVVYYSWLWSKHLTSWLVHLVPFWGIPRMFLMTFEFTAPVRWSLILLTGCSFPFLERLHLYQYQYLTFLWKFMISLFKSENSHLHKN